MRLGRKAVMDLPVRLMIVFIVLSLSLPVIANAIDENEKDTASALMDDQADRVLDTVAVVFYSGDGTARTVTVDIPAGCEMEIGGTGRDAYTVKTFYEGELLNTYYSDRPAVGIGPGLRLSSGEHALSVSSSGGSSPVKVVLV